MILLAWEVKSSVSCVHYDPKAHIAKMVEDTYACSFSTNLLADLESWNWGYKNDRYNKKSKKHYKIWYFCTLLIFYLQISWEKGTTSTYIFYHLQNKAQGPQPHEG